MSRAIDRYLYAVDILHGQYHCVRSVDVAHFLGVTKASVSAFVRQAGNKGLIEMEAGGNLRLSPAGRATVERLDSRIGFFRQLLTDAGVEPSLALRDAVSFSWEMSETSYEALKSLADLHRAKER